VSAKPDFVISSGFPETQRSRVAQLYWQAFGEKLGRVLGPEDRALRFFDQILKPEFCLTACTEHGSVIGVAGFKTAQGALTHGEWSDLVDHYGGVGALWRAPLLALLERPLDDDTLLMDGIAVAPEARGYGVGTQLLDAIEAEAERRSLTTIRLDVIDSNPRARSLYERRGFVAQKTEALGPLRLVFGFRNATQMTKVI